jgi:hypothetical protein
MGSLGQALRTAQKQGRYGDTVLAHISPEEAQHLKEMGGAGTINPETGLPEYFSLGKVFRQVANVVLPHLGAVGGAVNGLIQPHGGIREAIKGAAGSALETAASLAAPGLGQALGVSTPIAGAIAGAGSGTANAFLNKSNPLMGALQGGAGGYLSNGGFSQIGEATGLTGEGSTLGTSAGTPLSGGMQGPTQGSGILGATTRGISGLGSALASGVGGGGSSYGGLNTLGTALGGLNSYSATKKAQKDLETAGTNALSQIQPYQASGAAANSRLSELLGTGGNKGAGDYGSLAEPFTPGDLTQDPGYKFQLDQGQQAIDRSLGARGKVFSGEALKAASELGTGLADQTYKDAYARDAEQKARTYGMYSGQAGAGQNAANSAAGIYENIGNAKAGAGIAGSNIMSQSLSSLLSGSGARRLVQLANGSYTYV